MAVVVFTIYGLSTTTAKGASDHAFGAFSAAFGIVTICTSIGLFKQARAAAIVQGIVSALPAALMMFAPSNEITAIAMRVFFLYLLAASIWALWLLRRGRTCHAAA
jgi:hypothetical protein